MICSGANSLGWCLRVSRKFLCMFTSTEDVEVGHQEIEVLDSFHMMPLPTYQAHSTRERRMACSRCLHKLENLGHY